MTVPVVAMFLVKPGSESLVEGLFRGVIAATHAEEGCIAYQLNRDLEEPRRFVWTEEWANRELLDKHLAAPHIVELFAKLPEHIETSAVIALRPLAGGAATTA
ncbi:antibiotic biosynthesis monooxygenase [Ancylobacter sonchi]|uniref:putative quinol monooxygenase n=1 Tax=Ancylobacter sonchi TaxID=1937790 RepID=UPI001BD6AC2A|nr:putative quinol monooxygenase [Ancylobacter sonchi]MBS7533869.1 antibiotic biosynthesis monooxygenase [Ancylobacter sonchi]